MKRSLVSILATVSAVALLASCSGDAGRPGVEEIAESLGSTAVAGQSLDFTDDQTECIATALFESPLSDKTLRALVANDSNYQPSADENVWLQGDYITEITGCF